MKGRREGVKGREEEGGSEGRGGRRVCKGEGTKGGEDGTCICM